VLLSIKRLRWWEWKTLKKTNDWVGQPMLYHPKMKIKRNKVSCQKIKDKDHTVESDNSKWPGEKAFFQ
jgi:hypothetical protein